MSRVLWAVLVAGMFGPACAPAPRAFRTDPLAGTWRVAVLPLANTTPVSEAPDRVGALLTVEMARRGGFEVADPGRVEATLAQDPWILTDRIPPDLLDAFGAELGVHAVLVGSVLAYGFRGTGEDETPQVSLSLRLLEVPGGEVLWSAVHNRDGADRESVFGLGRTAGLERLAGETVREILATLPVAGAGGRKGRTPPKASAEAAP